MVVKYRNSKRDLPMSVIGVHKGVINVDSSVVACCGDPDHEYISHPKVYLRVPEYPGVVTCPYCELSYRLSVYDS